MEHNKEKASELRSVSFLLLLLPFPISFLCSREILHIARPTVYDDHRNLLLSICTRISAKPIDDVDEDLLFCFVVLYNSVTMSNQQLLSKLIASLSTSSSSSPRCFFFFWWQHVLSGMWWLCIGSVYVRWLRPLWRVILWPTMRHFLASWTRSMCSGFSILRNGEVGNSLVAQYFLATPHPCFWSTESLIINPRWPWTLDHWSQSLDTNAISISADDLLIQSSLGASTLVTESYDRGSNINSTRGFPKLALPPTLKANLAIVHYYPSYDHSEIVHWWWWCNDPRAQRCLIVVADNSVLVFFCFELLGVICNSLSFFVGFGLFWFCAGAIELSILCDHYAREIAAYDIQTMRCDLYGQVKESVTSVFFHFISCTTAFNLVMQSYL